MQDLTSPRTIPARIGVTVTNVLGCGVQHGAGKFYRGAQIDMPLLPKIKVEIVVSEVPVDLVVTPQKKCSTPVTSATEKSSFTMWRM